MNQRFDGPVDQVAAGNIINHFQQPCPGPQSCPYKQDESSRQAEFFSNTGIWCPREARNALEWLMKEHGFTAKELAISWSASSLKWQRESGQIRTNTPLVEALVAWSFVLGMLCFFLALALPSVFSENKTAAFPGFAVGTIMYIGSAWLAARFVLIPRRVALRAKPYLERYFDRRIRAAS